MSGERAGWTALGSLILLFTWLCGGWMGFLADNGYALARQDMASINQAIWNTAHGRPLQATILYPGVRDHFEPVLLLYASNYVSGGSLHSLLYLHALLIALGAIPLYRMARLRELPVDEALLAAAAYLTLPPLHDAIRWSYLRPDLLFFPALTLLAYALVFDRRVLLVVALLFALGCKESAGITIAGVGLYFAIAERRPVRGLLLAVFGVSWQAAIGTWILPSLMGFRPQHLLHLRGLSSLGNTLAELVSIRWPVLVAGLIAVLLLRRRWLALISLPQLLALLVYRVKVRYVIPAIPIPLFLALDELARWGRVGARRWALASITLVFVGLNLVLGIWKPLEPSAEVRLARPLLERIPDEAGVCSESLFLVRLSSRARLYEFNRHHYASADGRDYLDADYFLLNRRQGGLTYPYFRRHRSREGAFAELDALGLEVVAEAAPFTLYRRLR